MNIDSLICELHSNKAYSFIQEHFGVEYEFSFINDNPQFRYQCSFQSELQPYSHITLCEEDMNVLIKFIEAPHPIYIEHHQDFFTLPKSKHQVCLYKSKMLGGTALSISDNGRNYRVRLGSNEY